MRFSAVAAMLFAGALAVAATLPSCGGSGRASADAATSGDRPVSGDPTTACLEAPAELSRPPAGTLPCELIPPGLQL